MSSSAGRGKTARDLLTKMVAREREVRSREFLAPYTEQSKHAIVKIDGMNYRFRIVGFQGSGFGVFQPVDPTCARFVRTAEFNQTYDYLQILPRMYVILVCQTDLGWCAYPFNTESAKTKFGVDFEIIVRNASDVERFDVVTVRCDGRNFWFDEPFAGSDPIKADSLREAFALRAEPFKMRRAVDQLKGVTPEERKSFELALASWRQFQRQSTEGRLKEMLAAGGGELDNYVIRGKQIEITWQAHSGTYYKSHVDKDTFDVVSAGICLNDEDQKFHLKDLPGIIKEGEDGGLIYITDRVVDNPRYVDTGNDE